jgi:hypothetical protein
LTLAGVREVAARRDLWRRFYRASNAILGKWQNCRYHLSFKRRTHWSYIIMWYVISKSANLDYWF